MAITAFQANELVTRANVNSRLTEVDNKFTSVEGDITTLNGKFPVSIANGGTGGTSATAARTNLELMKAFEIYSNSSGIQGTVNFTTGYTASEFSYIRINYHIQNTDSLWLRQSVLVKVGIGRVINLNGMIYNGTNFSCYTRSVEINSTSLTLSSNTRGHLSYTSSSTGSNSTNDKIYITEVLGYKY